MSYIFFIIHLQSFISTIKDSQLMNEIIYKYKNRFGFNLQKDESLEIPKL